ncbi:hypothetical protein [Treponema sp.]|uniref:hypothetical protein n=1 Tax=Treponema sp. TaxID=166 RepID=UPI00388E73B8
MKRTLCAAALSLMAAAAFSFEFEKPFFSGTTGFLTTIGNDREAEKFDPKAHAESYFAGQFDFSGKLFLRGEFYTLSDSVFEEQMDDHNAIFRVEELSATYKTTSSSASHYLTLFKGNYEPFGSDLFLQRQFGIAKISSNLTESYHGIEGTSIHPIYSLGASYTAHIEGDNAFAISFYKNKANQGPEKNNSAVNFDLRYAGIFEYLTVDTLAGFSFPVESKDEGSDDLISIKEIQMHAGINALFGRKKSLMLYTQLGIDKIILKKCETSDNSFNMKDLYLLVEPRLPVSDFYFNPSIFNFPAQTARDMIYLRTLLASHPLAENILGCNFNLVNENLYVGSTKITAGIHATVAMTDINNSELKDEPVETIKSAKKAFILTPHANMEVFGGVVTASFSLDTSEFNETPRNAFTASVGFKTSF